MSQEHIKVLKWIRKRLVKRDIDGPFICHLLRTYANKHPSEYQAPTEIRRYIHNALGDYSVYGVMNWLHAQGYNVPLKGSGCFSSVDELYDLCWDYRIRWINHMMTIMKDWP